ncbi:addiction module antidote protein [Oceanidesulfovibrio marinus]|nr:addiction module antidote protein [Oceanidesulfovibrio marinus]
MIPLSTFDAAEYLDNDEVMAEYLTAAMKDPNPDVFLAALSDVARARGIAQLAKDTGLGRESLYKTLAPGAKPRFETIVKITRALGLPLAVQRAGMARRPHGSHTSLPRKNGAHRMNTEIICMPPLSVTLVWNGERLNNISLDFAPEGAAPTPEEELSPRGRAFARGLADYLEGRAADFGLDLDRDIPLDDVSDFSREVLRTLFRSVRFGHTTSYGELAAMSGRPHAARAVGRAMASNRWPLFIPCHRVLSASGGLTGFTGAGLPMKRLLLGIEGASYRDEQSGRHS